MIEPKRKYMAVMSCQCCLPEDLIIEILLRLPLRSLLRFKSTCREWNAMITSPHFTNLHFRRESNHTRLLLLLMLQQPFPSPPLDETYKLQELDQLISEYGRFASICGPCKGIFCVRFVDNDKLALWNPATRRLMFLPSPDLMLHEFDDIGLGVDPITDELKIVSVTSKPNPLIQPNCAVYALSTNSWRYIEKVPGNGTESLMNNLKGAIFVNGFCYWMIGLSTILAFDMHKEVFNDTIKMPKINTLTGICIPPNCFSLDLYDNFLALIFTRFNVGKRTDIWVMKEQGCWTQLYSFNTGMKLDLQFFGFWKKKVVALVSDEETEKVILYEPYSGNKETIVVKNQDENIPLVFSPWSFNYTRHILPRSWSSNYKESLLLS